MIAQTPVFVGGGDEADVHAERGKSTGKSRADGNDYRLRLDRSASDGGKSGAKVAIPTHRTKGHDGDIEFYIPASSTRGAVRHFLTRRIERAVSAMDLDTRYALDRPRSDGVDPKTQQLYGSPDEELYWRARFGNVLLRHLFGSEARRGAVMFQDLVVSSPPQTPTSAYSDVPRAMVGDGSRVNANLRVLTHNRLDRFTMASTEGLRNVAALEAGTQLTGSVTLTNFAWWQVGALALAFAAMNDGSLGLGTRTVVGLGQVSVRVDRLVLRWHTAVASTDFGRLRGIGACTPISSTTAGAENRKRRLGQFESDGARQMFFEDPEDVVSTNSAGENLPNGHRLFDVIRSWSGTASDEILREATARLAAAAKKIGTPLGT